jgi:hypothetical protein
MENKGKTMKIKKEMTLLEFISAFKSNEHYKKHPRGFPQTVGFSHAHISSPTPKKSCNALPQYEKE